MSNLKGVYLENARVPAAIAEYDGGGEISGPKDCGKYHEYELKVAGQRPAKLHVYYNNDTTTTLNYKVGANQVISLAWAEHVALVCKKVQYEQKPLALNVLSKDDWNFLIDYLRDEGYKVTEGKVPHGVRYDVWRTHGDAVNLNLYDTGRFLMQGKARELYGVVASILCDLVPDKKSLVQAQLKSYSLDEINAVDLFQELAQFTPSAVNILGETTKAIIAPSLALIKINVNLPDYSSFAYPALKGLEAYMKGLLSKYDYIVKNSAGMGSMFNRETLIMSVRTKIGCQPTIRALEESYKLYNLHRHALFHADGVPEFSRLVETKEEATAIVHAVLHCIESSSAAIP